MIALVKDKDLRLVRESPEGRGVNDAVAIAAERATRGVSRLGIAPPAAFARIGRIGRTCRRLDRHVISSIGICPIDLRLGRT